MKKVFWITFALYLALAASFIVPAQAQHVKIIVGIENTQQWFKCTTQEPVDLILAAIKEFGAVPSVELWNNFVKVGACIEPTVETPMLVVRVVAQTKNVQNETIYSVIELKDKNGTSYWAITGEPVDDKDI